MVGDVIFEDLLTELSTSDVATRIASPEILSGMRVDRRPDALHVGGRCVHDAWSRESGFVLVDTSGRTSVFTSHIPRPKFVGEPLVLIYACRVGATTRPGRSVQLGIAFLNAGSGSVVQTHWDVDSSIVYRLAVDMELAFDRRLSIGAVLRDLPSTAPIWMDNSQHLSKDQALRQCRPSLATTDSAIGDCVLSP